MIHSNDGGYFICGDYQTVLTYPSMDSYLQKIDSAGNEIWLSVFGWANDSGGGKDHAQLVKVLADSSVIVEGSTKDYYFGVGNYQNVGQGWRSYLAKLNSAGTLTQIVTVSLKLDTMWGQDYMAFDIETIGNTTYWLGIEGASSFPFFGTTVLAAFDANLDTMFTIRSGLNGNLGLMRTSDDHLLLFGPGILSKMDTLGNVTWTSSNSSTFYPYEVIELPTGEFVSIDGANYISPFNGDFYGIYNSTVYINRYSATGNLTNTYPVTLPSGVSNQLGFSIVNTQDHGYAFVGFSDDAIWLVKTDSLGQFNTSLTEPVSSSSKVQLFPNPASSSCKIHSAAVISEVSLYNIIGKRLSVIPVNAMEVNLEVNGLPAGMYHALVTFANGEMAMIKLMVRQE
jgi:hypothetical protein